MAENPNRLAYMQKKQYLCALILFWNEAEAKEAAEEAEAEAAIK